jgi:hypothetical protein
MNALSHASIRTTLTSLLVAGLWMGMTSETEAQMVVSKNTVTRGFMALPGPSYTKGLWAYEADGKQYCLQTRGGNGFAIIDMTDTSNPVLVGNVAGTYRKVQVWQNYAYLVSDSTPLTIVDMTDVTNPQIVGGITASAHTLRIDQSNGRLYMNRSSSLLIYDLLQDPTAPVQIGFWAGYAHDCRPDGDIVYVNGFQTNPTRILRVSNPSNPSQIGTLPQGNHQSALYITPTGEKVLLTCDEQAGGHVNLYNVDDSANPVFLSSYQTADLGASVHNVEVKGIYAYVAYYQDQLRVLDLSDTSNPVEVAYWDNNRLNTGSTYSDAWESIPDHDAVYVNQMYDSPAGNKGTYAIDFFPAFGAASEGGGAIKPDIWWSFGPASPGNSRFAVRLENARPNTTGWLIVGNSNTQWGPNPLPLGMGVIDAPNATLYVSPDFLFGAATDAQGNATVSLPIPANAPYTDYWVQWVVRDPDAPNVGGWAFSKAGKITLY